MIKQIKRRRNHENQRNFIVVANISIVLSTFPTKFIITTYCKCAVPFKNDPFFLYGSGSADLNLRITDPDRAHCNQMA